MWRRAVVFTLFSVLASAQHQSPQEMLAAAIADHQAGRYEKAIEGYRAVLAIQDIAQVRSNLGAALAHLGRFDEAIEEYERAIKIDARNPGARLNLGIAYYKTARLREAIEQFKQVRILQPDNRNALMLLADSYFRLGDYPRTIETLSPYESVLKDDRAFAYLLGTALIRDKQVERGQRLVDVILRDGNSAEAHMLLGTSKFQSNDFAGALVDLKRAVEINPNLPGLQSFYGVALLATGDAAGAMRAFREALSQDSNDFEANLNVGSLLKQDQQNAQALTYLERALKVRPGDPGTRYQIAIVHLAEGRVEQAAAELESLIQDHPEFVEAHVSLATAYYRLKRKDDGDRERKIVLKLNAERQAQQPGAKN
jgi:tetratricopeptide (TPR) repeat protein